ncbi:cilia- and flagella-associated protein 161-like [Lytechinus pictus]|uniref:cilia- and flagella-associated protein 161-like n=1 Tax=Lytechinus pictus TaxID=7653 RepID=UPI00240E91F5|nr:cilia- and flagella-associated protein 161-like [Lytechinus pictus]
MSVRSYNPSVRVGNWNEDTCLEEDMVKDFLDKKDKGELLIQKAAQLKSTILKPCELSVSVDGYVHYGDTVVIMNLADADQVRTQPGVEPRQDNVLSVAMSESKIHESMKFEGTCNASASRLIDPCVRNTFVITPVNNCTKPGTTLKYGEHFRLCTLPGVGGNLYMQSDRASFHTSAEKSRLQKVTFVEESQSPYLTEWRILPFNPQIRMESEGYEVPVNQKIVFNHCKTNQSLCVISGMTTRTPFGRDYEVVAHTDLDSHKAEKDVNHWIIKTGHPSQCTKLAATLPVGEQQ